MNRLQMQICRLTHVSRSRSHSHFIIPCASSPLFFPCCPLYFIQFIQFTLPNTSLARTAPLHLSTFPFPFIFFIHHPPFYFPSKASWTPIRPCVLNTFPIIVIPPSYSKRSERGDEYCTLLQWLKKRRRDSSMETRWNLERSREGLSALHRYQPRDTRLLQATGRTTLSYPLSPTAAPRF